MNNLTVRAVSGVVLTLLILTWPVLISRAQDDTDVFPNSRPTDVESVDGIMAAVYDVISGEKGEERDWERFRSLFRAEAMLISMVKQQDGSFGLHYMSLGDYINGPGSYLEAFGFFEVEISRVQENYGNIVHLFSTYESRHTSEDAEPFTRGINSFQLMNDGNRWWVVNIFWQGEETGAPIPDEYLPSN